MVLCFDLDTLDAVSALAPEYPTVLNLKTPGHLTGPLSRSLARVSALSLDVGTISHEVVAAAHDAATPVFAWTCNTPDAVGRALDAGADGLMSDRPGWLRGVVANRPVARPTS
jgi:glycerophosphoryl diester phosphodiesterase